jgi:iron-sulfur cluster assembly accessory protein
VNPGRAAHIQFLADGSIPFWYNRTLERPELGAKRKMVQITEKAVGKVKEIMSSQEPSPAGLRIAVVGGGCSGFSYSMAFENQPSMLDKTYEYNGLKIFVDQASLLYLDGAEVDYVETLEGAGFKFNNPQVKSTCGCGSSFQV